MTWEDCENRENDVTSSQGDVADIRVQTLEAFALELESTSVLDGGIPATRDGALGAARMARARAAAIVAVQERAKSGAN